MLHIAVGGGLVPYDATPHVGVVHGEPQVAALQLDPGDIVGKRMEQSALSRGTAPIRVLVILGAYSRRTTYPAADMPLATRTA